MLCYFCSYIQLHVCVYVITPLCMIRPLDLVLVNQILHRQGCVIKIYFLLKPYFGNYTCAIMTTSTRTVILEADLQAIAVQLPLFLWPQWAGPQWAEPQRHTVVIVCLFVCE